MTWFVYIYVFVILELGIRSIKDDKIVRSHLHVSSESSRRKKTQVCTNIHVDIYMYVQCGVMIRVT